MKKVILLLAIFFYFVSCDNGNNSSSKTTSTDTTATDTTAKAVAAHQANFYLISADMGKKMKDWKNGCKGDSCVDTTRSTEIPGAMDSIKQYYNGKNCTFQVIEARFKDKDQEDKYCQITGYTNPDWCKVKNKKTKLLLVSCTSLTTEDYYMCYTICPPPDCSQK